MQALDLQEFNIILSISAFFISFFVAVNTWNKRHIRGAFWFILMVFSVCLVALCYVFESAAGFNLDAYVSFSKIEYIGLSTIPLFWLGFALSYSGKERPLSPASVAVLAFIAFLTIVAAFTNEWHGLIWKVPRFSPDFTYPVYTPEYGTWFWVYAIYSYAIFLVGSYVLIRQALSVWRLFRIQAALVLVGTAMPWISNLLLIFDDLNPIPGVILNAVFLSTAMVAFAYALFRLRLLDIAPLAYDTILNNVPDGLIVTDTQNRILMLNRVVRPFLDHPDRDPIGKPLTEVFSRYASRIEALNDVINHRIEWPLDNRVIELRVSGVVDEQTRQRGRLFVFSDVTARVQMDQIRQREKIFAETLREISTTLNSTLDPNRVLVLILESLEKLVIHTQSNIMMIDPDGFTTRVSQHRGYEPEPAAALEAFTFDYHTFPTFTRAAQETEPLVIADTSADPNWKRVDTLYEVTSYACAPIRVDGGLVGFINLDGIVPTEMTSEATNRLQIFAQQAAVAIKNARLYAQTSKQADELKRRVDSLTITQQVYQEIVFSFNIKNLLEITLDAVLRLSQAEGAYIALLQDDVLKVSEHYGTYVQDKLHALVAQRWGIVGQAITEHHPIMALPPMPITSALDGVLAQIALPLYAYDAKEPNTLYGIVVLETLYPERFTQDRFQLLGLIADRLAVALENARLVDAVQARATELETLYEKVSRLEHLKSDMIRIAAHDLKNPLSVVLNYLYFLVEEIELPETPKEIYKAMRRASERMNQIIEDFLSLERIEKVAQNLTKHPFDLRDLVSKVEREFGRRATEKSQKLQVHIPDDSCIVNGDSVLLYEAITNFVSNAIKYTQNSGQIDVTLVQEGDIARLQVRDNGYGIPQDKQDRLFEAFYRAKTRETAEIEGTGLGLHLTKNIIEQQDGKLIFHSEYGKGSTFGFELPSFPLDDETIAQMVMLS